MLTIEEKIARSERFAKLCGQAEIPGWKEECEQLAEWLRELVERRKAPEIVTCRECKHYKPMSSDWGNCYVHGSPTELHRTCCSCDYCSWAERRTDADD